MSLRKLMVSVAMLAALAAAPARAQTPGISESEIKVGATVPVSGPASPLSNVGKGLVAYVHSVNDRGGVNGRRINLITYDDAYTPPKAVEQTRKLIESDEVAFLFSPLGTPGIGATIKYVTAKKVPHLFVVSGATKFTNFTEFPLTTTGLPSYNTEGKIYAKYIAQTAPAAKIAILYQNDDLGRDFVAAFKEALKADFDKKVVTSPYEVTEPTIESHVVSLKASGAQAFLIAGTPKSTTPQKSTNPSQTPSCRGDKRQWQTAASPRSSAPRSTSSSRRTRSRRSTTPSGSTVRTRASTSISSARCSSTLAAARSAAWPSARPTA
jgi:ABC-type branched-subunit amino acid transport system substrate-binding protein